MNVWSEVMRVNLDAMFMMAKHVGAAMVSTGQGIDHPDRVDLRDHGPGPPHLQGTQNISTTK